MASRSPSCWWAAAFAWLLLAMIGAPAAAQDFPKFTGFVVDTANVLDPAREAALTSKLDALQKHTGNQLVVATIPDLQGYPIEDYGYRLLRTWGVGLKGVDNGAILIVAPAARRVRIEVGYGLEPVLTDAFSSVIVNTQILPAFKAGDMAGGIDKGVNALIEQLSLPDDQAKAKITAAVAAYDKTHRRPRGAQGGVPLGLVFWGIVLAFVLLSMLRGRGGRRYRGGGFPIMLWGPGWGGGSSWGSGGGWSSGGGSSDGGGGGWMDGGFGSGGGGSAGGGGASGSW